MASYVQEASSFVKVYCELAKAVASNSAGIYSVPTLPLESGSSIMLPFIIFNADAFMVSKLCI